jgi:hypothetical protein
MPRLVGFSRFAALLEEQIGEKISQPTLHERRLNSSLRLLSARRGPLQAGGSHSPPRQLCTMCTVVRTCVRDRVVIGSVTVSDQNQRRLSGPPRVRRCGRYPTRRCTR